MTTSPKIEPRIFLDSSVLFAAAYSTTGSAHDLLLAAIDGQVGLVLWNYVLIETERNLLKSAPHVHHAFVIFRAALPFQLSDPPVSLIADTARIVVNKDAPIIAAARFAQAPFVATYDRKDLLSKQHDIQAAFGIAVATPKQILESLDNPRFRE